MCVRVCVCEKEEQPKEHDPFKYPVFRVFSSVFSPLVIIKFSSLQIVTCNTSFALFQFHRVLRLKTVIIPFRFINP